MDKERAKELLRAIHLCRESGCADECEAACAMLESDAELQQWFEQELGGWSAIDAVIAKKLECCEAPDLPLRVPQTGGVFRFLVPAMAAAALVMVGFFVFSGPPGETDAPDGDAPKPLFVQRSALSRDALAADMAAMVSARGFVLHHTDDKLPALNTWLTSYKAPAGKLDPNMLSKNALGCAILDWGGAKVSMICIKDPTCGGCGVVHVFVIDRSSLGAAGVARDHRRRSGLDSASWASDDKVYVMVGDDPAVKLDTLLL